MSRSLVIAVGLFLVLELPGVSARAQGLLMVVNTKEPASLPRPLVQQRDVPPVAYKIKELAANVNVVDQVARVQVSQAFVNTGSRPMEVSFVFPLPYDGAIDQMTFLIDGKELPAKLLPAKEARAIYESHVRKNRDPALLEWIGTGMFQTSVFPVPPGAERKVTMRYSQLLRKDHSLTDFLFPLGTAKYTSHPVEKVEIQVAIASQVEIKSVYSPTHGVDVKRPDPLHAVASYLGKDLVPTSDFRLFFDVSKGQLGASVLSYRPDKNEDGYLLLLASPQINASDAPRPRKTVVCVFDRSGSMSGKKIEQTREALKFILNNLREGDLFNIVAYDSEVQTFQPELQRYEEKTRQQALGFVAGLHAGGSTDIRAALTTALGMLKDSSQPSYVIFLTDGLPTAGETNESKIVEAAAASNAVRARLVAFGVGYDVNSRLLDRLSRGNFGRTEFVRPDEDIEAHVSRLYRQIGSPVITDATVKFEFDAVKVEEGDPINRMYPRQIGDLFEGEQLVLVARYKKTGAAKIKFTGKAGAAEQKFDFPASLVESSADQTYAFVEKLWAMRRIGEIIDQLDMKGRNEELIKELVGLSTRHGILTPYTSFLADENASVSDLSFSDAGGAVKAGAKLERLRESGGKAAFAQRAEKKLLQSAQIAAPPGEMFGAARGGGGMGGAKFRDIDRDAEVVVNAVQVAGDKVFYRRGNAWYSYDVAKEDAKQLTAKAKVIDRFSEEYFRLVREASPADKKALARQKAGEELILHVPSAAAKQASPSAAPAPAEVYRVK